MAGIYIHIPFCRQKCYYCDFYKTVNTTLLNQFLATLTTEAKLRKNYLLNEEVQTIYFGGGTPSVLSPLEITQILHFLRDEFKVNSNAEITLEANPDDLSPTYLSGIKESGVNRLSIGVQSFQNKHLEKMNRRHNAQQAIKTIQDAANTGFNNVSVDLIYGLPGLTRLEWENNLSQVFQLPVQHLSAYHLTYHEGTPFYTWLKKGTLTELKETESVAQFNALIDLSVANGFEHYEISNLAKEKMYSEHNSSYWMGKNYLGLGPSAHSFNGSSRSWNIAHVEAWLKAVQNKTSWYETENLSDNDKFNEYILTRIRTQWGISLAFVNQEFGVDKEKYLKETISKFVKSDLVVLEGDKITLSRTGLFVSDEIMTDLMII